MALTKRNEFGSLTLLADGQINARWDTVIEEDGVELTRTHQRRVFEPDQDPTTLPIRVRKIADIFWDAATIAAYIAKKQATSQP